MGKNRGTRCITVPSWRERIYGEPTGKHHRPVSLAIRILRHVEPWLRIPSLLVAPNVVVS